MQNIVNELNSDIAALEYNINSIRIRTNYYNALISRYTRSIDELKSHVHFKNKSNDIEFMFPSYNENLKKNDRLLLVRFRASSINKMISMAEFNKLKLEERRSLRLNLDKSIACNKPNKQKMGELNTKIKQLRVSISELESSIKEARTSKITELIKQNKSIGNDKLAVLYNFFENNGVKLEVAHPLYFDSSNIKNMLKELDELKVAMRITETEFESIKWRHNATLPNECIKQQDSNPQTSSSSLGISLPIIYSSEESLKWFESVIISGYINKLESVTLLGLQDELKTIKLEESLTLTKLNAKREKLRNVRYLPEWRRMQAYEKMLSLTASSTNPGASTV
jgi:hypothetical protein